MAELSTEQQLFLELWRRRAPGYLQPPVPEYRFAADDFGRQWRADLAFVPERIIIEFDGGAWARRGGRKCPTCGQIPTGRHNTGSGFLNDLQKLNAANALGYHVLRYPTHRFRTREAGIILSEVIAIVTARHDRIEALQALVNGGDPGDLAALLSLTLDTSASWGQPHRWTGKKKRRR